MRFVSLLVIATAGFMAMVGPSYAQTIRTWISGTGDDANPCSRTAPCQTFSNAITKTTAGGEINCLDAGGFGTLVITKAVTLRCDGSVAGVLAPGVNGIVVNAGPNDDIVLDGLDIEGGGSGLNGVNFIAGKSVTILRTNIRRFTGNGVNVTSSTSGARVLINDSVINLNNGGVNLAAPSGGIVSITNTQILLNTTFSIQANGAGNVLAFANSVLNAAPTAISLLNGASAVSFGPSNVIGGAGAATATNSFR